MEERQAAELVEAGMGREAVARSCKGGWSLYMGIAPQTSQKRPMTQFFVLQRARGGPRVFKTLEALVACAARIGFLAVLVAASEIAVRPGSDGVRVTRDQAKRLGASS